MDSGRNTPTLRESTILTIPLHVLMGCLNHCPIFCYLCLGRRQRTTLIAHPLKRFPREPFLFLSFFQSKKKCYRPSVETCHASQPILIKHGVHLHDLHRGLSAANSHFLGTTRDWLGILAIEGLFRLLNSFACSNSSSGVWPTSTRRSGSFTSITS